MELMLKTVCYPCVKCISAAAQRQNSIDIVTPVMNNDLAPKKRASKRRKFRMHPDYAAFEPIARQ